MVISHIQEIIDTEEAIAATNNGRPSKLDFFREHLISQSNVHL